MAKHNMLSGILVLVVILMIAISTYMVVTYATGVLNAAVAFASTDQMTKLQACGVTPPAELFKLRDDIPSLLIPALYVGFPGLMIILAILMFTAGFYYGNEKEAHSSVETTTTTTSPNRSGSSGRYKKGTHVEETTTQKSSESEGS
jgi:hypothetical protein